MFTISGSVLNLHQFSLLILYVNNNVFMYSGGRVVLYICEARIVPYRGKPRHSKVTKIWLSGENFPPRVLFPSDFFSNENVYSKFPGK